MILGISCSHDCNYLQLWEVWSSLQVVRMTELIDQSLASLSLLHDALLVILAERPWKLVIVHSWSVLNEKEKNVITASITLLKYGSKTNYKYLSLSPKCSHFDRVDNLEDALLPVDPVDVVPVGPGLQQQLLDKLPEVDVGAGHSWPRAWPGGWLSPSITIIILLVW